MNRGTEARWLGGSNSPSAVTSIHVGRQKGEKQVKALEKYK